MSFVADFFRQKLTFNIEDIEGFKNYKKSHKVIYPKHLPFVERVQQLKLPTLKYSHLWGDMIEVFKAIHN